MNFKILQYSPDELFYKFLPLSRILPDIYCVCPVQLCSAYLTALIKELVNQMLAGGFQMQLLVNLDTKSNESDTLQEVIDYASTEYRALEEEEYILNKNIHGLLKSTDRGSVSFTQGGIADSSEHATI